MEKIDLQSLDKELLSTTNDSEQTGQFIQRIVKKTTQLILQEREQGLQQILRSAILIESQLRLRLVSQMPECEEIMKHSIMNKGLCTDVVIIRTVDELLACKEIYTLSMIRV